MYDFPDTSESLIAKIRDPDDRESWERFEQLYRPIIFRIARSRGLQHSDALDLVQQVMMAVSAAIGDYERLESGPPFRHWLSRITRNAILKAFTRGPRDKAIGGSDILNALQVIPSSDDQLDQLIELEYRREVYCRAAESVRQQVAESTWLAFEMTVLQASSVEHVARALGLSVGSIYAARSRVIRSLRDAVRKLEAEDGCNWEQKEDESR